MASSSTKPGILRNLRIKRVDLVDMGANFDARTGDGAHIMLFKSKMGKTGPAVGSVHVDSPDWDADDMDEYEKADLTAEGRRGLPDSAFAAVWTDAQGKKHRKLPIHDAGHLAAARGRIDQAQIPADVKAAAHRKIDAKTKTKEKSVTKSFIKGLLGLFSETDPAARAAKAAEIEKALPDDLKNDDDADDKKEPVHKMDDPTCKCAKCMAKRATDEGEVAKRATELEKRQVELEKANAALQTQLGAEIEKRLDSEMRATLSIFKRVPIDLEKDVPIYRAMKASNPAQFDRVMETLKATEAQLHDSVLFSDVGSGQRGAGEGSAWAQIEAKADAIIEKSTKTITREAAIEKVLLDPKNNKLVKQYRAEQQ